MKQIEQQIERITDMKLFRIEEKVYLQTNNICIKEKSKKLKHKSIESFKIKRNIKRLNYELDLLKKM